MMKEKKGIIQMEKTKERRTFKQFAKDKNIEISVQRYLIDALSFIRRALARIAAIPGSHLPDGGIQFLKIGIQSLDNSCNQIASALDLHIRLLAFLRSRLCRTPSFLRLVLDKMNTGILTVAPVVDRCRHIQAGLITAGAAVDRTIHRRLLVQTAVYCF